MLDTRLPMTSNDVVSAANGRVDLLKNLHLFRAYMTHLAPAIVINVDPDVAAKAVRRWNYEFSEGMYIPGLLSNLAINAEFISSLSQTSTVRYVKWTQHIMRNFNQSAMDQLENQVVLRSLAHFFRDYQTKPVITNETIVRMRNDFIDVERNLHWVSTFSSLMHTKLYEFYLVERFAELQSQK